MTTGGTKTETKDEARGLRHGGCRRSSVGSRYGAAHVQRERSERSGTVPHSLSLRVADGTGRAEYRRDRVAGSALPSATRSE